MKTLLKILYVYIYVYTYVQAEWDGTCSRCEGADNELLHLRFKALQALYTGYDDQEIGNSGDKGEKEDVQVWMKVYA